MTEHATITPDDCACSEHIWTSFVAEPEDWGEWVICSCCGMAHQLQPGEKLIGDEVFYSADWLND